MSTAASHDPLFVVRRAPEFRREHIADLAAGRCAAVRVPRFLPTAECESILRRLATAEFDTYDPKRVSPTVMRFGAGVSDHRQDGRLADSYWPALDRHRAAWASLGLPYDPFEQCRRGIGKHWPGEVRVARSGGRELAPGVAREPNGGFIVHYDDARREFTGGGPLDAHLTAQFAFNLYLSVPDHGGETVVWRRQWDPADESHRRPLSYGFTEDVVGDAESIEMKPQVGEALLFSPRNYHAVRPSRGGRRIALGFTVGLTDTGDLLTWG